MTRSPAPGAQSSRKNDALDASCSVATSTYLTACRRNDTPVSTARSLTDPSYVEVTPPKARLRTSTCARALSSDTHPAPPSALSHMTWNTTGTSTRKSPLVSRCRKDLRTRSFSLSSSGGLSLVAHDLLRAWLVSAKSARGAPLGSTGGESGDERWETSTQRCRASRRDTVSPPSSSKPPPSETPLPRASEALLLARRSSSRGRSPCASMPSAKVRADPRRRSTSSRSARMASERAWRPPRVGTRRRYRGVLEGESFRAEFPCGFVSG